MPVEERSLTSGTLLEETKSPEIGVAYQLQQVIRWSRKELYSPAKTAMSSESRPRPRQSVVCWRVKPVGEPDAGNPQVRFDEREVETEHGRRILRHVRGNPDTEVSRSLNHRATSRLYPKSEARVGRRGPRPMAPRARKAFAQPLRPASPYGYLPLESGYHLAKLAFTCLLAVGRLRPARPAGRSPRRRGRRRSRHRR